MSWFPQIGAGSVAQFPLSRSRRWRVIVNQMESNEVISLPDTAAGQIGWKLSYQDLTDTEVQKLGGLFTASHGAFGAFTFIDPLANLLGWSETLSQSTWQLGLLQATANVADPLGTQRASSLTNTGQGTQSLRQSLGVSGDYVACFSAYLRSSVSGSVTLQRDGTAHMVTVGPSWQRFFVNGTGVAGASQSTFSIVLAAGQTIDVWGLQLEAQPYPSLYKQTSAPLGIYEETYFAGDELAVTSTGVGFSSCEITLISRV
ncbi:MAG TPA: hypothetical protein VHY84_03450 [Bryobacteraceae bacterium]|jgi:hypothetical protein|nr:hypothetical protein [Bryobacteraceae bacterium]